MKVNNVDIMNSKRFKFIFTIIIFMICLVNMNISLSVEDWLTKYSKGMYAVEAIDEGTAIQLVDALIAAGEIEDQDMFNKYKECFDNLKKAGKKRGNEKYYFNMTSIDANPYNTIKNKIDETQSNFDSPPTEEEQEDKKNAFKEYTKKDYSKCSIDNREKYWNALKESSKYVSKMNKEDLNLYVKCLNAFRKSPGGITLIGEDPTVQRELNGILLGISSRYYDDLDKDSREIMEETGNIEEEDIFIFKQPSVSDSSSSTTDSIDGLLTDSETFLGKGENNKIKDESIQDFSKTMYNILITIATFVAVLVGGILGVKIMIASADEKAQVKELLIPYVIGCIVVFGAFGIWKLVVTILQNM